MCNYGAASVLSGRRIVQAARQGLASLDLDDQTMLLLSPSGNMFDDWEVPARARERIFQLARQTRTRAILCETRADTLVDAYIANYARVFDDRELSIGIGLESADPWILKYSINKALRLHDYRPGVEMLHRHGVVSTSNVLLGSPFLSEPEAIADAVASIRWSLSAGTDYCVLFPAHVKTYTLLQWLWQRQMYLPPSLWSLVEVLFRVGREQAARVTISWHKDYLAAGNSSGAFEESPSLSSPTTCPGCHGAVITLLDKYRDTNDFGVIRELRQSTCNCRRHWQERLDKAETQPLVQRISKAYEAIGRDILGDQWWVSHGRAVLDDLLISAEKNTSVLRLG